MLERIKKYTNWILLALIVIVIFKSVENYQWIFAQLRLLTSILAPFFWGFAIAYILNPLMVKLEARFKMSRIASMALCYIVFFGVITLFLVIVTPIILRNLFDIIQMLPIYGANIQNWFDNNILAINVISELNLQEYIRTNISEISSMLLEFLNLTINGVIIKVIGITSGLLKFIVGIVVSGYILNEKESFIKSCKKMVLAVSGEELSNRIIEFAALCNDIFSNFFIGKTIDSFIVGIICFVGLTFIKAPYALLLSLIVAIFNMIPYFGPFIGAVPAVLLTLFVSPIKALWVVIFILLLQQFDGNVIGPKILGDKVGISPFYIILSILIGGGFFGMIGMLFAVPLCKILIILINGYFDLRIEKQSKNKVENL